MNVLMIGGGSRMADAIIDKLNKGNHRVYLLTGQREKKVSYKHVFEKYDFSYEDDSVRDIFESVKPELILFLGAYDTNFSWQRAGQDSMHYAASLMNILSAYAMLGKGRFVYFSSHEVYGGSYIDNVPEMEQTSPVGAKAMALAQGESICDNFRRAQELDILILRFDHVYWIPDRGQEDGDICFKMCLEALKTGKISGSDRNVFSMLYLKDAVELASKAIMEEKPKQSLYHISSMEKISEKQLAGLLAEKMGAGVELVDTSAGEYHQLILDGRGYQTEYGQRIFTDYEKGTERVVQYMKRHSSSFLEGTDTGGSWFGKLWHNFTVIFGKLVPFMENMICFIPFFMLNNRAVGSAYFDRLDFYLLYVLLFAIVHGQQQAVFSALLAVAGYCFRQMYGRTGFEVLLDYNTYVWMAQLFILGMVVGYMKDRLLEIRSENEEEISYLNGKMNDIADINDSNVRMKQNFETQLVNQRDSLGKVYEITSGLEQYSSEEVLFYAARVLSQLMDSRDVAVYRVANRDYARLFSATSPDARKLGNSIEYSAMEAMYHELREHRVFINRTMDETLPLMAGAVYEADEMRLILMIWSIPWQRMTLAEANRLMIVGALIQNAALRANRYLEALKSQRFIEGTNILSIEAFSLLVKAFFEAQNRELTEYVLLEILAEDQDYERAAAALGSKMRQTDYMGMLEDGKLYILLPNTDEESARGVMERIRVSGYESRIRKGGVVQP